MTDTIGGTVTIDGVVYEFTAELFPVGGGGGGEIVAAIGTMDVPRVSNNAIGLSGARCGGFRFTSPVSSIELVRVTLATEGTVQTANWKARLFFDAGGSPGAQIGAESDPIAVSGPGDKVFSWSARPALVPGTPYWIIFEPVAGTAQMTCSTVANDQSYGSGRHDAITSITAAQLDSGRDFKCRVEYRAG